ncbi:hypothetical protein H6775_03125 [Candidatus Nomurabacteria bacterium]|nr:hypothetical protein [Candidatus Nomurabacteria bacterium]
MIRKYKKIIIIVGIAIVLFFVFLYFTGGSSNTALIKSTVNSPSGAEAIGSEIIQALNQIETLKLDGQIFEDPVYRSLVDRSQVLTPEPVGRSNPFAPLGVNLGNSTTIEIPQDNTADDADQTTGDTTNTE